MFLKSLAVATALTVASVAVASATPLVIGTSDGTNAIPFASGAGQSSFEYQQAYTGAAFNGPTAISSFSFTLASGTLSAGGSYTVSLSSSSNLVSGLDGTFANNIGTDAVTVSTGSLPAVQNGLLTFVLPKAFIYNPATSGDLLLDIKVTGLVPSTARFASTGNGDTSRLYTNPTAGARAISDDLGLVTTFDVPAPMPLALLASGVAAVFGARRRNG